MTQGTQGLGGSFRGGISNSDLAAGEQGQPNPGSDSPFSSALILARILEGGDVGNHLNEFLSLSRETDPELFYEGLYNLGVRLENSGHGEMAGRVYSTIVGAGLRPAHGQVLDLPLQHRAQQRFAALRGEGSVGLRLEVLGRSFARQAMAPAPLIGMGVAGLAFRGMNLFAATRLANLSAGLLTRGPGLRVLSGLVGFAAEVPAFTFGTKFASSLLGEEQDYSAHALRTELASGALVLGSLKLFGLGFGQLGNRLNVGAHGRAPVQVALQQAGMLTGIMAGHGLEVAFGLRERQAASLFLAESLVTLAQFNVAGRLSNSVFGERYERLQRSLAMQAEAVSLRGPKGSAAIPSHAEGLLRRFAPRNDSRVRRFFEAAARNFQGPPLALASAGEVEISPSSDAVRAENDARPSKEGRSYMMAGGEGGGSSGSSGPRKIDPRQTLAVLPVGSLTPYGNERTTYQRAVGDPAWYAEVGVMNGHLEYRGNGVYVDKQSGEALSLQEIVARYGEAIRRGTGFRELQSDLPLETDWAGQIVAGLRGPEGETESHLLNLMGLSKRQIKELKFGDSTSYLHGSDQFALQGLYALYRSTVQWGLPLDDIVGHDPRQLGLALSSGLGGMNNLVDLITASTKRRMRGEAVTATTDPATGPLVLPALLIDSMQGLFTAILGPKGASVPPGLTPEAVIRTVGRIPVDVGACATGYKAFADAADMFRPGWPGQTPTELAFFGSSEAAHGRAFARPEATGFNAMKAMETRERLAKRNGRVEDGYAPLTTDVLGFWPSEGAGVGALMRLARAIELGLPLDAAVAGYSITGDQGGKNHPAGLGLGGVSSLLESLLMARDWQGLDPRELEYMNLHGTGTPDNNKVEPSNLLRVLDAFGYEGPLKLSAYKALLGHGLGAAGSMEIGLLMASLRHQLAPGAFNLSGRDLDANVMALGSRIVVSSEPMHGPIRFVGGQSQGFAGNNGSALFRALNEQVLHEVYGYSLPQIEAYQNRRSERLALARQWEEGIRTGRKTIGQFLSWFGLGSEPTPRRSYHFLSVPDAFRPPEGSPSTGPGQVPAAGGDELVGPGITEVEAPPDSGTRPASSSATALQGDVPDVAPARGNLEDALSHFVEDHFPPVSVVPASTRGEEPPPSSMPAVLRSPHLAIIPPPRISEGPASLELGPVTVTLRSAVEPTPADVAPTIPSPPPEPRISLATPQVPSPDLFTTDPAAPPSGAQPPEARPPSLPPVLDPEWVSPALHRAVDLVEEIWSLQQGAQAPNLLPRLDALARDLNPGELWGLNLFLKAGLLNEGRDQRVNTVLALRDLIPRLPFEERGCSVDLMAGLLGDPDLGVRDITRRVLEESAGLLRSQDVLIVGEEGKLLLGHEDPDIQDSAHTFLKNLILSRSARLGNSDRLGFAQEITQWHLQHQTFSALGKDLSEILRYTNAEFQREYARWAQGPFSAVENPSTRRLLLKAITFPLDPEVARSLGLEVDGPVSGAALPAIPSLVVSPPETSPVRGEITGAPAIRRGIRVPLEKMAMSLRGGEMLTTRGTGRATRSAAMEGVDHPQTLAYLAEDFGWARYNGRNASGEETWLRMGRFERDEQGGHRWSERGRGEPITREVIAREFGHRMLLQSGIREIPLEKTTHRRDKGLDARDLPVRHGAMLPEPLRGRDLLLRKMGLDPKRDLDETRFANQKRNLGYASDMATMGLYSALGATPAFGRPLAELFESNRVGVSQGSAFIGMEKFMEIFFRAQRGKDSLTYDLQSTLPESARGLFMNLMMPQLDFNQVLRNPSLLKKVLPEELAPGQMPRTGGVNTAFSAACASALYALWGARKALIHEGVEGEHPMDAMMMIGLEGTFSPYHTAPAVAAFSRKAPMTIANMVDKLAMQGHIPPRQAIDEKGNLESADPIWARLPDGLRRRAMNESSAPFTRYAKGLVVAEASAALPWVNGRVAVDKGLWPTSRLLGIHVNSGEGGTSNLAAMDQGIVTAAMVAMRMAQAHGVVPQVVQAHGTSTELNSIAEIQSLYQALRYMGYSHPMSVSAIKGLIGHSMGAAAAVDIVMGVMSLMEQRAPGLFNFRAEDIDPKYAFMIPDALKQLQFGSDPIPGPIEGILILSEGFLSADGAAVLGHFPQDLDQAADLLRDYNVPPHQIADWKTKAPEHRAQAVEIEERLRRGQMMHRDVALEMGYP